MKRNLLMSLLASVASVVAMVWLLSMPHVAEAATCDIGAVEARNNP